MSYTLFLKKSFIYIKKATMEYYRFLLKMSLIAIKSLQKFEVKQSQLQLNLLNISFQQRIY